MKPPLKTYELGKREYTTVHDIAGELGIHRRTVLWWLVHRNIPHVQIHQGKKIVATLVSMFYMPRFRKLNAHRIAKRDHLPYPPGEAA